MPKNPSLAQQFRETLNGQISALFGAEAVSITGNGVKTGAAAVNNGSVAMDSDIENKGASGLNIELTFKGLKLSPEQIAAFSARIKEAGAPLSKVSPDLVSLRNIGSYVVKDVASACAALFHASVSQPVLAEKPKAPNEAAIAQAPEPASV